MTIAIGVGGLAAWKIVQRIEPRQIQTVARDPVVARQTAYFADNIARAGTAGELVEDYRLLSTALQAFGLEGDIANRAFIRKVLESDPEDKGSLVNRLADKRYLQLARAFGYGAGAPAADLAATVGTAYVQREFERRIGQSDDNLRLALNARRELQAMAGRSSSDRTLWYEAIGNTPLRKVLQGAFGFPDSYGRLPVERQAEEYAKAAERLTGGAGFARITTPEGIDRLVQTFMVRAQTTALPVANRYSAALTLLRGG